MKDLSIIFIDQQKLLEQTCKDLAKSRVLSVDTEFERSVTYFSKPSIIQIASRDHNAIIDARASLDLTQLKNILLNTNIVKVFHSSREDLEIFFRMFRLLPQNVFDTQIAAKLCGFGSSISYSNLCSQICDVKINKEYQRANWLQRPIPKEMLKYAADDVKYLEDIYNFLLLIIENQNLQDQINQAMEKLTDLRNYKSNPNDMWKKVNFSDRSGALLPKIKVLAAFREECAMEIDVPRKHFLNDRDLVEICKYLPTNEDKLKSLKIVSSHITKEKYQDKLIDLCIGLMIYE